MRLRRLLLSIMMLFIMKAIYANDLRADIHHALAPVIKQFNGEIGLFAQVIGEPETVVEMNADKSYLMASTYKIPIMVQAFREMDEKRYDLDKNIEINAAQAVPYGLIQAMRLPKSFSLHDLLLLMITISDNTASDRVFRLIDKQALRKTLYQFGIKNMYINRSVKQLLRDYAEKHEQSKKDRRDTTTPRDMARLLTLIVLDKAASPESCKKMLSFMSLQKLATRIPYLLSDVEIANKTGSLGNTLSDVGVLQLNDKKIVMAIYAKRHRFEDPRYHSSYTIARIARIIYQHYQAKEKRS